MIILVIDAQGGGIGRQLVSAIKQSIPAAQVVGVGTNSTATAVMLKAGADHAATGENAVVVNARRADIITGPIGIVVADSLFGEITPAMAAAVGQSDATRVLIPISNCNNVIAGIPDLPMSAFIQSALERIQRYFETRR